jgi:sigma-B regulation protein RsbU (phosphoserine phosphatase)
MMSVNNLIKYRAREGGTPGEILTSVNSQVCMNNKAMMFATVWMGILDPDSGVITCANAGHERPAVSAEGGGFKLIDKDEHGTPIGMLGKMRYKDYEIRLKEGESIFLYTDGVTEAKNGSGEFYSAGRMIRDLADAEASASPRMIIDNMSAQIEEYVQAAEQFDDITMLCLTYYGNRMTKGIPDDKM